MCFVSISHLFLYLVYAIRLILFYVCTCQSLGYNNAQSGRRRAISAASAIFRAGYAALQRFFMWNAFLCDFWMFAHARVLGTIMRRAAEGERSAPPRWIFVPNALPPAIFHAECNLCVTFARGIWHSFSYCTRLYMIFGCIWHCIFIYTLVVYDTG